MILDMKFDHYIRDNVAAHGSFTMTVPVYLDAFDTTRVYEEDPLEIFGAMVPEVKPLGGLIGKMWDERRDREYTIEARPWMALFDYTRRSKMRVAEIDLCNREITVVNA